MKKPIKELKPIVRNIGKTRELENGVVQLIYGVDPITNKRGWIKRKNGKYLFKDALSIMYIPLPEFDEE